MSMEDILKLLVESRKSTPTQAGQDPLGSLIGGLLNSLEPPSGMPQSGSGSHAPLPPQGWAPQSGGQTSPGLSDMMGMLEMIMGDQVAQTAPPVSDPILALLQPFVGQLARKMKIPPEIAMIIISFVVHKLLAHYPTSNRDSNTFDLDSLLQQMGTGKIDTGMLESSGMIRELSHRTGLDETTTTKSLNTALMMFGNQISGRPVTKPRGRPAGRSLKSTVRGKGVSAKRVK